MCCTFRQARLKNTILYGAEAEVGGKLVHVLGYQNQAENLSPGANAMILPFPARAEMGPSNVVDVSGCKHVLKLYALTIDPPTRSFAKSASRGGLLLGSRSVQVFESGMYTVVLADDARDIAGALYQVPDSKRPKVNEEILEAYAAWYPRWPIALCCFESRREVKADPMIWWYEPKDESRIFTPALDAHDGRKPSLSARVELDHVVCYGSLIEPAGDRIPTRLEEDLPDAARPYLATRLAGQAYHGSRMPNGDFWMPVRRLRGHSKSFSPSLGVDRVAPAAA
jgi:hypothetical protein